jgi:anti-sigma factor RsiW
MPSDEELVAYLDGELDAVARAALDERLRTDAAAQARLAYLRRGGGDFAAAFDRLFDSAPADRLAAMLKRVQAESRAKPVRSWTGGGMRLGLIAAGVLLFIIGGGLGYFAGLDRGLNQAELSDQSPGYWREVVADYVDLYSTETFAGFPEDRAILTASLAGVGGKLGLNLNPDNVALPGLTLKGPVLFTLHGSPLAQVAYLSKDYGPIAFCMIANGQPDQQPAFETRGGRNIVYWAKGGRGYLVIGTAPRQELEAYAAKLNSEIS